MRIPINYTDNLNYAAREQVLFLSKYTNCIIDGERKFFISGEFPYFRVPKKDWGKANQEYLIVNGICTRAESKFILGGFNTQTDLKASMNSYVTFKDKFGELVDLHPELFENIILWHTLSTDMFESLVIL